MTQKTQEAPMIYLGTTKEAITEARAAINDILSSGAEQETLRKALDALGSLCSVNGATISNCSFTRES